MNCRIDSNMRTRTKNILSIYQMTNTAHIANCTFYGKTRTKPIHRKAKTINETSSLYDKIIPPPPHRPHTTYRFLGDNKFNSKPFTSKRMFFWF